MSNRGCFVNPKKRAAKRRMILQVGKCELCDSAEKLTIDHIIPRSRGGVNAQTNWQVLCESCNFRKKSYTRRNHSANLIK